MWWALHCCMDVTYAKVHPCTLRSAPSGGHLLLCCTPPHTHTRALALGDCPSAASPLTEGLRVHCATHNGVSGVCLCVPPPSLTCSRCMSLCTSDASVPLLPPLLPQPPPLLPPTARLWGQVAVVWPTHTQQQQQVKLRAPVTVLPHSSKLCCCPPPHTHTHAVPPSSPFV